jgi:MFS family permease
MLQLDEGPASASTEKLPSAFVRYYVLVVLVFIAAVQTMDRQIVNIMVEPIRIELGLSDSQMGLLTGFAFALVYSTLCIPAARLADSFPRRFVIAGAVTIWSFMTIACGFARGAVELFLARFGVGFGEAGGTAPSQALLSDLFPRGRRATVMAAMMIAPPLGTFLGLAVGGLSLHAYGWRHTFMLAGLPGLILAPLALFTFPSVRKGLADGAAETKGEPFGQTLKLLWSVKAMPNMMMGATLGALVGSGTTNWVPAFLERSYGLERQEIGAALGISLGGGALIGAALGGPLADWLGKRDMRWHLWLPILTSAVQGLAAGLAFVLPLGFVFPLLALQIGAGSLFAAPMISVAINLAPTTARATALACLFFAINAFGMGSGPALIGVLSDAVKPSLGNESLRFALICATMMAIPACYFFWRASRTYLADIAKIDAINRGA